MDPASAKLIGAGLACIALVGAGMVSVYRAVAGIKTVVGYRRPDEAAGRGPAKDKWDDDEE